jgi:hypothetical protein
MCTCVNRPHATGSFGKDAHKLACKYGGNDLMNPEPCRAPLAATEPAARDGGAQNAVESKV